MTLENTFNLFLSQLPLLLLGLLTHLQALDFSRSLACLFWRIRELAMAAAMAATAPAPPAGQARRVCWPATGATASMLLGCPQCRGCCWVSWPMPPTSNRLGAWEAPVPQVRMQQFRSKRFCQVGFSPFDFLVPFLFFFKFYSSQLLTEESLQAEVSASMEIKQAICKTSL